MHSIFTRPTCKVWQLILTVSLLGSINSLAQTDSWTLQPKSGTTFPTGADFVFTIGSRAYALDHKFYDNTSGFSKDFWEYDPETGAWSQKASFGGAGRTDESGFSIGTKGYVGLGMTGPNTRDIVNDFWEYDVASNSWSRKADVANRARFAATGFAINGKGYFSGGFDWFSIFNGINEYDPVTDKWATKASIDTGFYGGISFTIGNKAYIGLGSKGITTDKTTNQFYEFDPLTNTVKRLTDFAGDQRVFAKSFGLKGKGYVTSSSSVYDFWQYDPVTNKWLRKTDVPGRAGGFVFSLSDKGYVSVSGGNLDIFRYEIRTADTLKVLFTGNTYINLDWENFNSTNPIVAYDIYVDGVKKYTTAESEITADNLLPNTSYSFKVTGRDANGNSTSSSDPVIVTTTNTSSGLNYRYFEGNWDLLPNFNTLSSVKSGQSTNVDISTRNTGVNDHFGFVWEGYLTVPTPGNYTFETASADGSRFYFNSFYNPSVTPLINNDGVHNAVSPIVGAVNAPAAGQYPVTLTFFNKNGGASMQLYWTGPPGSGITRQLVPNAAFSGIYNPLADITPPSVPANLKALTVARNFVNLQWDKATDDVGVAFYDIYVNGVKRSSTVNSQIIIDSLTENSNYTFTVNARDVAGNNSAFSNAVSITTINTSNGLNYRYYEGNWNALPDFNSLTPLKTGVSPNADISVRPSATFDHFGFVWEGSINIPYPGTYTFETLSDDGSRIYFNSLYSLTATPTVDNDGVHGASAPVTGSVTVATPGQYPIAITYFEKDSHESLQLYWTGPAGSGIERQLIPDNAFKGSFNQSVDSIAPSVPLNIRAVSFSRNSISLDWDNATDNVGVAFYDVYINGVQKYSTTLSEVIADSLSENTSYTFTIKARDFAGNTSAFSNAFSAATSNITNGLTYRYYEGDWNILPDFNSLTPVKTGLSPNVDISQRTPGVSDHFGFVWEGNINITTPGNYTFETLSDDGSKLYFNTSYAAGATPLINNDGLHAATPVTGSINIPAARRYPISIAYFEKDGGESMQVYWTGPAGSGITRQLIPDVAFKGDQFNAADLIAPTVPQNLRVLASTRNKISLDWDNATDNVGVAFYDIYLNGVLKYTTVISELIVDSLQPAFNYNFSVKARDIAGNTSAFSTTIVGTTTSYDNGLTYKYYEGNWDNLPDFSSITPVKTGLSPNIDISVRPAGVNDHFGFVWEGSINFPRAGVFKFETVSDDGSKLYFNTPYSPSAIPLINNDGVHGAYDSIAGTVTIPVAGQYPFAVSYFEKDGGESMKLYWTGPPNSGITKQLIPDAAFTANYNFYYDTFPPIAPVDLSVNGTNATALKLSWNNTNSSSDKVTYEVFVNGVKNYATNTTTFVADSLLPNTTYNVKVRAVDSVGNNSLFSNEVTAKTLFTSDGLDYKYYEGTWDKLPDFSTLTPVVQGTSSNIDINIRPAGRDDNFAIVWNGYIKVPVQGSYYFEMISDDGSKLTFNNINIINNDGLHAATSSMGRGDINIAGVYPISLSYFEKDGDQKLELYWTYPGQERQLVPQSAFVRYVPGVSFVNGNAVSALSLATEAASIGKDANIKMYPNPFSESFQIDFNNTSASNKITVGIYDLAGRLVMNRNPGSMSAGRNSIKVRLTDKTVVPGIYIIKLMVNEKVIKAYKMVKAKR